MRLLFVRFHREKDSLSENVVRLIILGLLVTMGIAFFPQGVRYMEVLTRRYHPIYAVDTTEKVVSLTFDISWGREMAPKVLDILKASDVKATFFLSGPWVRTHEELARRIAGDGHEVGSHGEAHVNFSQLSQEGIVSNVQAAAESIRSITGVRPQLIRTPNGDFDDTTILTLHSQGYQVIDWKIDSLDWKNPGVETIIQRVLSRLEPGAIILMHASDSCKLTDQALPTIIEGIRAKGYRFTIVSDLLTKGPTGTRIR